MLSLRDLRAISTLIDEYPMMRKYQNKKIAPTILSVSILAFIGLVIFNVFTQGRTNRIKPFLSPVFVDETVNRSGDNITCQPSSVALYQNFFTIPPKLENHSSNILSEDTEQSYVYSGLFQWKIDLLESRVGLTQQFRRTRTGFLYSAETLNCTIDVVRVDYEFDNVEFSIGICGRCLFGNADFTLRVCTSWDTSTVTFPGTQEVLGQLRENFFELQRLRNRLSMPASSLPLSVFPPGYNETQEDLYQGTHIGPHQASQLTMRLRSMKFISPPSPQGNRTTIGSSTTIQSPEGKIVVGNTLTSVPTILEAFKTTDSVFAMRVSGIGYLKLSGGRRELAKIPQVLQSMFNQTMNANSYLMELAARDLHGSRIGVNYLCVKTNKVWHPFLKAFTIVAGSSIAVFTAFHSILVMLARRIDTLRNNNDTIEEIQDSHHSSDITIQDREFLRLPIKNEE
ncbi:hypothetical protein PCASD_12362 [Puccinia coronata f. sp. avenae]|uniref:Uncharacterized protein n=1 Tax=Puccinia coronata f. sp. avenae TaxID=200324 RepID=A0A2N5U8B6_9BASI|nr:hypothetical protein PCASD_12362 [Puccinia coronata f. sp. avenae]